MKPVVFLNGFFVESDKARVSVFDRGFCYGDGLFETMRIYKGNIFRLDLHLERLYGSAPMIHLDLPVTRKELSDIIRKTSRLNRVQEGIVRLTLTRGESAGGLRIDPAAPVTLVVFTRPIDPLPRSLYQNGVNITLMSAGASKIADLDLQVKSGNYLARILLRERASASNSHEAILLDEHDRVTDGTTSNIFLVREKTLFTPRINAYVLPGVTRHVVLEIARNKGIPIREQDLTRQDVYSADEVFLTSTGIEILPVRQADSHEIGNGQPGPMTQWLHGEFMNIVEERAL